MEQDKKYLSMTAFPKITFNNKRAANNGRNPPCPFPALLIPFPVIVVINEEVRGCINEEVIGAIDEATIDPIIAGRNPPSCFFILCFTVSLAPSTDMVFLL